MIRRHSACQIINSAAYTGEMYKSKLCVCRHILGQGKCPLHRELNLKINWYMVTVTNPHDQNAVALIARIVGHAPFDGP